jgi:DNA-binding PadR family transcriptional regulator
MRLIRTYILVVLTIATFTGKEIIKRVQYSSNGWNEMERQSKMLRA